MTLNELYAIRRCMENMYSYEERLAQRPEMDKHMAETAIEREINLKVINPVTGGRYESDQR